MLSHLHHHVPHVVELLRVQEGGELLARGDAVVVAVRLLEAPLVPVQHGLVGGLLLHIVKLLAWFRERPRVGGKEALAEYNQRCYAMACAESRHGS